MLCRRRSLARRLPQRRAGPARTTDSSSSSVAWRPTALRRRCRSGCTTSDVRQRWRGSISAPSRLIQSGDPSVDSTNQSVSVCRECDDPPRIRRQADRGCQTKTRNLAGRRSGSPRWTIPVGCVWRLRTRMIRRRLQSSIPDEPDEHGVDGERQQHQLWIVGPYMDALRHGHDGAPVNWTGSCRSSDGGLLMPLGAVECGLPPDTRALAGCGEQLPRRYSHANWRTSTFS